MGVIKMMQGDSYSLPVTLTVNGSPLNPDMVSEIEICVGEEIAIRKTYSEGTVNYDSKSKKWYIRPTQEETLNMEPGSYEVIARIKYKNEEISDVKGVPIGRMIITDTYSNEVI